MQIFAMKLILPWTYIHSVDFADGIATPVYSFEMTFEMGNVDSPGAF